LNDAGTLSGWKYFSSYLTGCTGAYIDVQNWTTYVLSQGGIAANISLSGVLASYQTEYLNAQFIPPIHSQYQLPLVLTPWHLSHLNTLVSTNTSFWNSIGISWQTALHVAIPYTTSQSQTGTTLPGYASATGFAYPLWNAIRKRNALTTIPDNFTTNIQIQIQNGQAVVLGIGPSPPNSTGWYNHVLTNRIQQLGANDIYYLDGSTGVGEALKTPAIIPDTDPVSIWNESIFYTGQEYTDYYMPFSTGSVGITGTNIAVSDQSLYSQSPSYITPITNLPAPEKVIWPNALYPTPYNNVSYSQMAEAILILRDTPVAYGSLTISQILNAYRNLYVADPINYLPLFDREYNTIVANPSWVYLASPTPNNSLAYIMYYGA